MPSAMERKIVPIRWDILVKFRLSSVFFFFSQSNNCTAGKFILREFNFWFCLFTESSHCNGNPCRNGGICTDTGDGFECNCQSGFTGRICQIGKSHDIRPTAGFLSMFLSVVFRCLVIYFVTRCFCSFCLPRGILVIKHRVTRGKR